MALQPLHTPEDLAAMLGRSRWWVCEQCRRGRFPSIKPGGSYRFTDQHVDEILAILEQAPAAAIRKGRGRAAKPKHISPARSSGATSAVRLEARPPRRRRGGTQTPSPAGGDAANTGRATDKIVR
jgi:hypothetical protein